MKIPDPDKVRYANTGHGHVFPRPDGLVARCGGPLLCHECAKDEARKATMVQAIGCDEREESDMSGKHLDFGSTDKVPTRPYTGQEQREFQKAWRALDNEWQKERVGVGKELLLWRHLVPETLTKTSVSFSTGGYFAGELSVEKAKEIIAFLSAYVNEEEGR